MKAKQRSLVEPAPDRDSLRLRCARPCFKQLPSAQGSCCAATTGAGWWPPPCPGPPALALARPNVQYPPPASAPALGRGKGGEEERGRAASRSPCSALTGWGGGSSRAGPSPLQRGVRQYSRQGGAGAGRPLSRAAWGDGGRWGRNGRRSPQGSYWSQMNRKARSNVVC